jgi:hypothetical protein
VASGPAPYDTLKLADLDKNGDGIIDFFTVLTSGYDAAIAAVAEDGTVLPRSPACDGP